MISIFSFWIVLFSSVAFSQSGHQIGSPARPRLPNPMSDYPTCVASLKETIDKLNCKVPPVLYAPGLSVQKTTEYGVQFYAARLGMSYDRLNALVSLTQSEEGKKKLLTFFSGLKCTGLPGDPINRKNWKSYLPPCPKEAPPSPPWYKDSKWATSIYHPGAHACLRMFASRPQNCRNDLKTWECIGTSEWMESLPKEIATILKDNSPSQQCCYDLEKKLITKGAAAGTPDMIYKTHHAEEIVQHHLLRELEGIKDLKVEDLEAAFSKLESKKQDHRASMDHYILDARIITACFPDWPGKNDEHVTTYQSLGWAPLE